MNSLYKNVLLELGNYSLFSSTGKWKRFLIITPKLSSCCNNNLQCSIISLSETSSPCPTYSLSADPWKKAGNQSFPFPDITWFSVLFLEDNAIIHHKTNRWIQQVSVQFKNKTRHKVKISVSEFEIFFLLFIALRNSRAVSQSHFLLWKGL